MKKFISMVMAAAMVVSLVPATAFAAKSGDVTATAKIIDAVTRAEVTDADKINLVDAPELQLKIKSAEYSGTDAGTPTMDVTLTLDGAELTGYINTVENVKVSTQSGNYDNKQWRTWMYNRVTVTRGANTVTSDNAGAFGAITGLTLSKVNVTDDNEVTYTFAGKFQEDDIIAIDLASVLDDNDAGTTATVSVSSDMVDADDLVYAKIEDRGIKATVKKVAEVAEEERVPLKKDLKIEATAGDFVTGQRFELKLSNGFEFDSYDNVVANPYSIADGDDDNVVIVTYTGAPADNFTIDAADLVIEAVSAKAGTVGTITVKAVKGNQNGTALTDSFTAKADAVEVIKVIADAVIMSVDEDKDVPVFYSGTAVGDKGLTSNDDHKALEVTIEESVEDAWDGVKAWTLSLPEGVYAVNGTTVSSKNMNWNATATAAFQNAYKKGDFENFEFGRRTFTVADGKKAEIKLNLVLVAEPGFTGDVTLTLEGDAFDEAAEVVIAKFVAPYTVEAAQNDLIIDYRYTEVPTNVVIKEAEEGLWAKGTEFAFGIEKLGANFEDDVTFTVDDESGMEVKAVKGEAMSFKVDETSDDGAAAVTISNISLYMNRTLPAGAYDLLLDTTMGLNFMSADVFGTTDDNNTNGVDERDVRHNYYDDDNEYVETVKEGFINIITAGRDQDDASFTKKVVVPVGENYIVAGEETVALDVPAYISAAGYTMLPVRAVAVALGINNNNVLWDQATKTVTILYGQRIITMQAGQKVVYVNGSAIPASASVEIKDGRTFLPMRDLATALGVTDITWDAATKTATLNGNK